MDTSTTQAGYNGVQVLENDGHDQSQDRVLCRRRRVRNREMTRIRDASPCSGQAGSALLFLPPPSPPSSTCSSPSGRRSSLVTMSSLSSFFPSRFLGSMHSNPRDRQTDPLSRLRFTLETMPGSRKYNFTLATRAEILAELYDAFWGPYAHLFLPNSNSSLPLHATLSEVQASAGQLKEHQVLPGRPCGNIFKKGESCFRCK